ncbi:hemolysin secretion protein D [Vibrio sp. MACH09]|uniref:efflux RND transporter periplasmic adaptor subunit n=1 Tax=Vibrio sp. MACH09 TaxID=3025122 RepID=UPI0027929132|nr:efflux RND transporter periplasmic adaptor subunit [Vibrio sp. MACH09]GLO61182.1 hemolysin secretion protein D [Vibrio sp. MACH09]
MRVKTIVCILSLLGIVAGCKDNGPEKVPAIAKVKVVKVGSTTGVDDRMFFPAIANAADRARLSFRVSGEVSKLMVRDGDRVTKGQLIAEIDPTDYQLAVDNARASYSVANSQYKRSEQLVKKGLLAQSQFDELAAQRMIAKSELDLASLQLSFTTLNAPYDGLISRVNVEQFENINIGQQVVNIHNPKQVDIVIQVPDKLFAGSPSDYDYQQVQADVRLNNGNTYRASLKEYTTEQDAESATYTVTLTMPMPENDIVLDGMAVDVAPIQGGIGDLNSASQLISIPIEAVFTPDGEDLDRLNKYVWVVGKDNSVSKTKVVTRKVNYKKVQVVSGLTQGDSIVVAGVSRLRDGMKVELVNELSTGSEGDE